MNTSAATMVLLPVPFMPVTNQLSSIVASAIGMKARPWSISAPVSSTTGTPTIAQSACRQPLAQGHLPLTTRPPSACRTRACGENTPAIRASGSAPQMSSCNAAGPRPANQEQTLSRVVTQAVEPQALASSRETSSLVRMSACRPPNRRGTMIL